MKVTKAPVLEFLTKILDTDLESNERHLIPSGENLGREKRRKQAWSTGQEGGMMMGGVLVEKMCQKIQL